MKKLSISISAGMLMGLIIAPLWSESYDGPGVCERVGIKVERTPGYCYLIKEQS